MKKTDDYELFDTDFDEFIRIGMEAYGLLPFEPTKQELNEGDAA